MKAEDEERIAALEKRVEHIRDVFEARLRWLEDHSKSCVCTFVDGKPVEFEECGYHAEMRRELNRLKAAAPEIQNRMLELESRLDAVIKLAREWVRTERSDANTCVELARLVSSFDVETQSIKKRCSFCDHWAVVPHPTLGERCEICEREGTHISVGV